MYKLFYFENLENSDREYVLAGEFLHDILCHKKAHDEQRLCYRIELCIGTTSQVFFETTVGSDIDLSYAADFEAFVAETSEEKPQEVEEVSWFMSLWIKFLVSIGIK